MPIRVNNPPAKPLIIWDGECHFCRRWIERWREITRDSIDYATSQESDERFPEIPREQFERSVMVFARSRFDFSDRVRLALGADRRTYWVQRNYTGQRISSRRPRATRRPRIVDPADPVLAQFERRLSPFSLWRRSCVVAASGFWHRTRTVVGRARCFLSFAHNRRTNVPQLSVGYSPSRDRLLVDLSRALAALAETRK